MARTIWLLLLVGLALAAQGSSSGAHRRRGGRPGRQRRTLPGLFAFTHAAYNVSIAENSRGRVFAEQLLPAGDRMGIYVPHPDGIVRYKIVTGDTNDYFKAVAYTIGNFAYLRIRIRPTLSVSLNREHIDEYSLLVKATFKQPQRNTLETRAKVNVIIKDENDLRPLFLPDETLSVKVSDDMPLFSEVTQVYASDADQGINGQIYFSLLKPSPYFALHPVTGKITLVAPLDAGQQPTHTLIVLAHDKASKLISGPGRPERDLQEEVAKCTVTINVIQANRHPPTVLVGNGSPSVELGRVDTQHVTDIRVEDDDPGSHGRVASVNLLGDPDGWFRIRPLKTDDSKFVLETLPGESIPAAVSQFNLTVVVTDAGQPPRTTQTPLAVSVKPADTSNARFRKDLYTFYVNETSPEWTIVGVLRVKAAHGSNYRFSIKSGNTKLFSVNETTGTIRLMGDLDFESAKSHRLQVELLHNDVGHLMLCGCHNIALNLADALQLVLDTAQVQLQVLDENDNSPEFTLASIDAALELDPSLVAVESTVFQVNAADLDSGDNGRLSYRLLDAADDDTPFIIDEWTGEIKLRSPFGASSTSQWTLRVRVADWGRPLRRENETTINIRLSHTADRLWKREALFADAPAAAAAASANSHTPAFGTKGPLAAAVMEDAGVGEIVFCATATDDDYGYAGLVQYAIEPATNDMDLFDIGVYDSCIRVLNNLTDRPLHIDKITLSVRANDQGLPVRQSTVNVQVTINDVNNHKPVFDRWHYRVRVSEDVSVPTQLLTVRAVDDDKSRVRYSLLTNTDLFSLDATSGVLSLDAQLDRERVAHHVLKVLARDTGNPALESTAEVVVEVEDVNDNAPRCLLAEHTVQLVEDWPPGALVTCIQATDPDEALNGKFTFGLESSSNSATELPFRIDLSSGCIWIADDVQLDYETRPVYNLTVEVTDRGQPAFSGVCRLLVELIDVNENLAPPVFEQFADQAQVFENQPVGTEVARVQAHDPEMPDRPPAFSLLSHNALGLFTIDDEGVIRTSVVFDREQQPFYWLTVVARDLDLAHPLLSYMDMYITIADRNDHAPLLRHEPLLYASVPENSPPGRMVTRIQAIDPDTGTGEGLTYKITRGDPQSFFTIDPVTGYLSTHRRRLDRETLAEHELEVLITDSGSPSLSSTCIVVVKVTDVNDVAPAFTHQVYNFNVPEVGDGERTLLCRVTAHDGDTGVDSQLTYNISLIDMDKFEIDASTGEVYAVRSIEPKQRFTLTVGVSDGEHSASCRVTMDVLPVPSKASNQPPRLRSSKPIQLLISDSDEVGQMLALLEANDPDGDHLWFDVRGDDATRQQFTFRRDTGELQLLRPLDPTDSPAEYDMTYSVTDGRDSIEAKAHIRIRRTVASRPRFSVDTVKVAIPENQAIGSTIAQLEATVNTTSGSDASITYSLHSIINTQAANMFKVEPSTGRIVLVDSLDREVSGSYVMVVAARHRSLMALCTLNITVNDVNDHTPVFTQNRYSVSVLETATPGTNVLTLSATDKDTGDNCRITYNIVSGNEQGLWSLDASSGDLSVASALSLTYPESVLVVRASDQGRPVRSHTATVRLLVAMAVDSAPRFSRKVYTAKLFESSKAGSFVTAVFADSVNGVLYGFANESRDGPFSIHPTSGIVSLRSRLDFESSTQYNLTVVARSPAPHQAGQSPLAECQVLVTVMDSNDHAPVFLTSVYNGSLPENMPAGTVVTTEGGQPLVVSAQDKDRGANALITYYIVSEWAREYFTVDYGTGAVRTVKPLDFEKKSEFMFEVGATDLGEPPQTSAVAALVNVSVQDINDNAPQLLLPNDTFTVTMPTVKGVVVAELTASDADSVGSIAYSLEGGCGALCIDERSGRLSVHNTSALTSAAQPIKLVVLVTDGVHVSTARVRVRTATLAGSGLQFVRDDYSVSVVENVTATSEQSVLSLAVSGTALGEHVTYELLNNRHWFVLGRITGELRSTGRPLDRERTPQMALVVRATDARHPPRRAQTVVTVHIQDVNDRAPVFMQQPYYAVVPLDAQAGHNVSLSLHAVDADEGDNAKLRYSLEGGGSAAQHFGIDSVTGRLSVTKPFAAHMKPTDYELTVRARDMGTPSLWSEAPVRVSAVDAAMPVFSRALYNADVAEAVAVGSPVASVSAVSHVGGSIGYAIVDGDPDGLFALDFVTGIVRVRRPLDRETQTEHKLTIRAIDVAKRHVHAHVPLHIKLLDVNDNAPVFGSEQYSVSVAENRAMGSRLLQVIASDADLADNALVTYELVNSADSHAFEMNRETGELYLMRALDYEQQKQFELSVKASDTGKPVLSSVTTIRINVNDVNDCPPQFQKQIVSAFVVDNCERGHFITKLLATDADTQSNLTYSIIDGDASPPLFHVQSSTGIVTANRAFAIDELWTPVYHLNVSVSDGVYSSTAQLHIAVQATASRTSAPVFERQHYDAWLNENEPIGANVITVKAVGGAAPIKYTLGGDVRHSVFVIEPESGKVSVAGSLDYERRRLHNLPLVATDSAGRRTFATVSVNVRDDNDNAPAFVAAAYTFAVPLNASLGVPIGFVLAIDPDVDDVVEYSMDSDEGEDLWYYFDLHRRSGKLSVRHELSAMAGRSLSFSVRAADRGNPPLSSDVPVTLHVVEPNAPVPHTSLGQYEFDVGEEVQLNTKIADITVIDSKDYLISLVEGADGQTAPFAITSAGRLSVQSLLDRELTDEYNFVLAVADRRDRRLQSHANVKVRIADANDNSPQFHASYDSLEISEDAAIGSSLAVLSATDADLGHAAEVNFQLKPSVHFPIDLFRVDASSGWLMLNGKLDREQRDKYEFTVMAVDGGYPSLTTTRTVRLRVLDSNDCSPQFSYPAGQGAFELSVPESASTGTLVGQVVVTDADLYPNNVTHLFITAGDPFGQFDIDDDGRLRVRAPLDYETRQLHELTVVASDGLHVNTTVVRVAVLDENDNAPVCQKSAVRLSVDEDTAVGSALYVMLADDADEADNAKLTFSLKADLPSRGLFDVTDTGMLVLKQQLDRLQSASHHLVMAATDAGGRSCETAIELQVLDVNNQAPAFEEDDYELSIEENLVTQGHLLAQLRADDRDLGAAGQVRYAIESAAGLSAEQLALTFYLDELTGALVVLRALDRETRADYKLLVRATDLGTPSLSGTATVRVVVTDVNDSPPEFELVEYKVLVNESAPVHSLLGTVRASSADAEHNAHITYKLHWHKQTPDQGLFDIADDTGNVYLRGELDFERQQSYALTVQAVDSGQPPLMGETRLIVQLLDENDNAPEFTQQQYSANLLETAAVGHNIIQMVAHDADSAANGRVNYEVSTSTASWEMFNVTDNGTVVLMDKLDRETLDHYRVVVKACDGGQPEPKCDQAVLLVTVVDVNDNPPKFETCDLTANLPEAAPLGEHVLSVQVADADLSPNSAPFKYNITGPGAEYFRVTDSGDVLVASKFNYNKQSSFLLTITAVDAGSPSLQSECPLQVQLVEESKYAPVVDDLSVEIISYLGEFAGAEIGNIKAYDKDKNDRLEYAIVRAADDEGPPLFAVDKQTGIVRVLPGLPVGEHLVNVSVTDHKFTSYGQIKANVRLVTEDTLDFALNLNLHGASTKNLFEKDFQQKFTRTVADILGVQPEHIELLSVQDAPSKSNSVADVYRARHELLFRAKRHTADSGDDAMVQLLFTVSRGDNTYYKPAFISRRLGQDIEKLKKALDVPLIRLVTEVCRRDKCVRGDCRDKLSIHDTAVSVIQQPHSGQVFLSPRHEKTFECICQQGFGGPTCNAAVNACSRQRCEPNELCVPLASSAGYECVCVGNDCPPKLCQQGRCAFDSPMSFTGNSYLQYTLSSPLARRLQLKLRLRTKAPNGVLMHMHGNNDFHTLQVRNGYVEYVFDCGSGLALVAVTAVRVDDGQWHWVHVNRRENRAALTVDELHSANTTAPGRNAVLNLYNNDMYFGGEVYAHPSLLGYQEVKRAFTGCLDKIFIDEYELPRLKPGLSVYNVQFNCKDSFIAGVCSSQPCKHFGKCVQQLGDTYTCECAQRYTGTHCEIDRNPCLDNPCAQGATCVNSFNTSTCRCPVGRYGVHCEHTGTEQGGPSACLPNPCLNGGLCVAKFSGSSASYQCECAAKWTGPTCALENTTPNIIGNYLGISLLELLAIILGVITLLLLALLCCFCCRRRHRYRYEKAPYAPNHHNDVYLEQNPHLRNPQVAGGGQSAPPLPPRAGRGGVPAFYAPNRPPHQKLSNLQSAQMTGLPTGLVRPLSIADRGGHGGSSSPSCKQQHNGHTVPDDASSSCGAAGSQRAFHQQRHRNTALDYGSAAGSFEHISASREPRFTDVAPPPLPAHKNLSNDNRKSKRPAVDLSSPPEYDAPPRPRKQSMQSIQCLPEDDPAALRRGRHQPQQAQSSSAWDYAGSDWASTLGINPPYGGDDGHSTLPPGVSALDDDDEELPLGDVDPSELKSSPEFRQQLLALQRMNDDAEAMARHNRAPRERPTRVVQPSTLREDEYVTMRPAAMRHTRHLQDSEQRQPLMTNGGGGGGLLSTNSDDDDDADSCGAVVQYAQTGSKASDTAHSGARHPFDGSQASDLSGICPIDDDDDDRQPRARVADI